MSDEHIRNLIEGDVPGTSIMGRDISGGISVTNVFGDRAQLGSFAVSELSVAVPDNVARQQLHGRDDLVAELTELAGAGGRYVVLTGAGGCGKSALAAAVGDTVRAGRAVWWVDGTTRDTLVSGLFEVAVQAGVSRAEAREVWRNGESAKDLLWRALRGAHARPWLLIVDNADEPALLDGWLREPPAGNTVLVTSRDHRPTAWGRHAVIREVLPISDVDGAVVLRELAPDGGTEDEARRLAARLGGLPLALVLVGAYLARTGTGPALPESRHPRSFAEYTAALDTEFPDTIAPLGDQLLVRTWERSLDLLESQGVPAARPLFRLLAFFSAPVVPAVLLVSSVLRRVPTLFPDLEVADLEQAVDGLIAFGLLGHRRVSVASVHVDTFVLHTLIGEVTRIQPDALANGAHYRSLRLAVLHHAAVHHDPAEHATWPVWRLLLPLCTFTDADLDGVGADEYRFHADVAYRAGNYAGGAGLWTTAEDHYGVALMLWHAVGGPTDPNVIVVRQNLAYLKVEQGRFAAAERELRDIVEVATTELGPDASPTLTARHELARVLREQGKYEVAEQEFARLVPQISNLRGAEDEHTLAARHEHIRTRRDLGDLDAALTEFEDLVAIMTRVLGSDSLRTLSSRHEMAGLLKKQGRLTEARAIFADVIARETRLQGFDHPSTLASRLSIAEIDLRQGRLDEADTAFRDIVAAWARAGEENHPSALYARSGKAAILIERGDLAAGEAEYRSIKSAMTAVLGAGHPETFKAHWAIINLLLHQEKNDAALRELREYLPAWAERMGGSHEDVLALRLTVADLLFKGGEFAEAEVEYRRVAFAQSKVFGREDRRTLATRSKIAAAILKQGKVVAARDQLLDLVSRMELLGGVDGATLAARTNLAYAHRILGDVHAAVGQLRETLSLCGTGEYEEIEFYARSMLRQLTR